MCGVGKSIPSSNTGFTVWNLIEDAPALLITQSPRGRSLDISSSSSLVDVVYCLAVYYSEPTSTLHQNPARPTLTAWGFVFWGSSNLYGSSVALLIETIFLLLLLVFVGSFLYNFYFLGLSADYDYSGLGPLIEKSYEKDFLLVTQQGIGCVISLNWKKVSFAVSSGDKLVVIGKRGLFGSSKIQLAFVSVEDAKSFEVKAVEYLRSV